MSSSRVKSKSRLRSIDDLEQAGLLNAGQGRKLYDEVEELYDIGVTPHISRQIQNTNFPLSDAVGRQYIPSVDELNQKSDEEDDPIGDDVYSPVKGIVHRYPDRVLLKVTNVCGVYCRYCFRREMIGAGAQHLKESDFDEAFAYIKSRPEIWEVILTGGDPFVLSPQKLEKVISVLGYIDHVQVIRIHTRIPVADPEKIDEKLLSVLKRSKKPVHIVVHVNHKQEIAKESEKAFYALRIAGCSLYSQSVLLKGVNDSADILEDLFRKLVSVHVKPYYLHHPDRAKGTSHFRVSIKKGQEIMNELQGRVSGICLPKYMLDIPGGHGKIPVQASLICQKDKNTYSVTDYQGCNHLYIDNEQK